jgi:tetrapyrrole methylase family protein / MazG family protein
MHPLLARLGLSGCFQVHQHPVVLQPDQRAHQVFVGFSEPSAIQHKIRELYPPGTPVFILADTRKATCLAGEDWPWPTGCDAVVPAMNSDHPGGFYGLVWVMDRLLGSGGCPWDQEQTHQSLKRHLIEEAYELLEAIDRGAEEEMIEELGDVLLQPVFHGQIAAARGDWSIEAPIRAITEKLFRRHPHVFGDLTAADADEVLRNWDRIKKQEKEGKENASVLGGVPQALPALMRAMEISKRAARSGFEWPNLEAVWDKVREEEGELREAWAKGAHEEAADELADLLFSLVNVARWMKIDPEEALQRMISRFSARFRAMESAAGRPLADLSPQEWDDLWNRAKEIKSGE